MSTKAFRQPPRSPCTYIWRLGKFAGKNVIVGSFNLAFLEHVTTTPLANLRIFRISPQNPKLRATINASKHKRNKKSPRQRKGRPMRVHARSHTMFNSGKLTYSLAGKMWRSPIRDFMAKNFLYGQLSSTCWQKEL